MQSRTLETQPVTAQEIISWAMSREAAEERSRIFLQAKMAALALTGDVDDIDTDN